MHIHEDLTRFSMITAEGMLTYAEDDAAAVLDRLSQSKQCGSKSFS